MQSAEHLAPRREAIAKTWELSRGAVIIPAGLPIPREGTDQYHEFHAHPEFAYLAATHVPGAVLTFDPHDGWRLFAPTASLEDRVWVGEGEDLGSLAAETALPTAPVADFASWLEQRRAEPLALLGSSDITRRAGGYGLARWHTLEVSFDHDLSERLSTQVSEQRRAKDAAEVELMRQAAEISRLGHLAAWRLARPGTHERRLQVELEAEFFRNGAPRTAYGSIVGTGSNGAVLHFSPTERQLRPGELVLIDAGAEIGGYASDVTRTFPVSGRFEGAQRDLYQLVLAVQRTAISNARPGVEYKDLHLAACAQMASGLVDLGILRGDPQGLVDRDAHALFFPHGLGHMLGLSTHDAGGCLAGRTPSDRFGLKWLRADLPLQPGYVVTIEPGIYFIKALLTDQERREHYRDDVNWERVDAMLDFGGIRIEDDVLITGGAADVLSGGLPTDIAEIERLRQEALQE